MFKLFSRASLTEQLIIISGILLLAGIIFWAFQQLYPAAEQPGPYAKTNQVILESAQPGDLIVCAVQNPVPPTTENISQSGLVIRNAKGWDSLGIILFDRMVVANNTIGGGVKYAMFDDCKVSIIKERAEKVKTIGEAVLSGSQQYMQ